jgi:hypothetical protein
MALNGSGPISLAGATAGQSIAVELGLSATGTISLNQTNVRTLAGVPSGAIIMPTNFYGKSNSFNYTMTSSTLNGNLRTLVVAAGWNQSTNVNATINSGVYAYANSTGQRGLVINGSWPGGVTLNNAGFIIGMGGNGGDGLYACNGTPGAAGGLALLVQSPVSINNTGTIGGGGGGGGGGGAGFTGSTNPTGGGGGGGRTGLANSSGGISRFECNPCYPVVVGGNGGCGTSSGAGSGGGGGGPGAASGGPGGNWGANGSGGGTGSYGGFPTPGGGGGAGGAATSGSASFITWIATGTRNGAIG